MLERLDYVIDPGLGRSVTQLGMIANVTIIPTSDAPSSAVIGSVSATLTGDDPAMPPVAVSYTHLRAHETA